jgi:AraC-like DNA-binding protein
MILSHRKTALTARNAYLSTHAVVHSAYRVHVVDNDGVVSDDRIALRAFQRKGALGRPVITVVLAGAARIDAFAETRWLEAGDVSAVEAKNAIVMRQSRDRERYRAFVVEWDDGPIRRDRPRGFEVSRCDDAAIARAADAIVNETDIEASLRSALTALGFSVDTLAEEVSPQTRKLSRALDDLLSDMSARPMAIDLHEMLSVSLRQLNRLVLDFNERYGFNAVGWRDTRGRRRLLMGAALMTARGATVDEVARAVGYTSPTAFARAMADAGLPPPGEVARAVDRLRD